MRKTFFASAALLGVFLAGPTLTPAFAQDMTATDYLKQSQQAVQQHHRMQALTAVDQAEAALLKSGAAQESSGSRDEPGDPPVLRQIGKAREAIQQRHWQQATDYLKDAIAHASAQ